MNIEGQEYEAFTTSGVLGPCARPMKERSIPLTTKQLDTQGMENLCVF